MRAAINRRAKSSSIFSKFWKEDFSGDNSNSKKDNEKGKGE
jgi:hypothetical protein